MNATSLEEYAERFRSLHVDHDSARPRPHKPVMLLSVLTLAETGRLLENRITYSPDLLEVFAKFFEAVREGNDRRTPFNPFFYLRSDRFWHLSPQPGQDLVLKATRSIRGPGQLVEMVSHASLDEALFGLLADPASREVLRLALIDRYFPNRKLEVLGICAEERAIGAMEHEIDAGRKDHVAKVADAVRDAAFTRLVRRVYDYTCAMCGLRFVCDDVILVDATHLIPFSESRDDSPANGMALCKNHHWLMDRRLIAPGPGRGRDYDRPVWHVSPLLDIRLEAHRSCVEHRDRSVLIPRDARYRPAPKALDWRIERLRQWESPERPESSATGTL